MVSRGFGVHQDFLRGDLRRRGFLGDRRQLELADDLVHHGIFGQESDDLHRGAASRAEQEGRDRPLTPPTSPDQSGKAPNNVGVPGKGRWIGRRVCGMNNSQK